MAHLVYGERLLKVDDVRGAAHQFELASAGLSPNAIDVNAERVYAHWGYTLVKLGDSDGAMPVLAKAQAIRAALR